MRVGKKQIKGTLEADTWVRIYSNTLTEAATSVTISDLDGDTDVEWLFRINIIGGYNGAVGFYLRPNNDTGNNYGFQYINGEASNTGAARSTATSGFNPFANCGALGQSSMTEVRLYAKSGFVRTAIGINAVNISTTTVGSVYMAGYVWNNTTDNITSLTTTATQANGLGIGTTIELFAKKASS